ARARLPARLRPRAVRHRDRRGGARRVPPPLRDGGDRARARVVARPRARPRPRRGADPRLPFGPRRQGPRNCFVSKRRNSFRGFRVKTLVIYLMAAPETPELARAAVDAGADVV